MESKPGNLLEKLYEAQNAPDCGKVILTAPSTSAPSWDRLAEDLREVLKKSGFTTVESVPTDGNYVAEIVIGSATATTSSTRIYACYDDGWHFSASTLRQSVSDSAPTMNVVLSLLTACIAALIVFRKRFSSDLGLNDITEVNDGGIFSFLGPTHKIQSILNFHNTKISWFGCGSIAYSACFALREIRMTNCQCDFVDNDRIKPKNAAKYFGISDREVGQSKAEIISMCFASLGTTVAHFKRSLNEYAEQKAYDIELAVISTDTSISRRDLQAKLPKIVLNSWTGVRQSLLQSGVSRHEMDKGAPCLICEYWDDVEGHPDLPSLAGRSETDPVTLYQLFRENHPTGDIGKSSGVSETKFIDSYKPMCDAFNVKTGDLQKEFGVPFISAISGALLAFLIIFEGSGIISTSEIPRSNTLRFVSSESTTKFFTDPISRHEDCVCNDSDYIKQYRKKWSSSS